MNNSLKITFVMAAYNCEKTIRRAVESIINQTYQNIELIIVNDGSTDKTKELLKLYSKNNKVKIFTQENAGPSIARNFGINKATGDFIAFCDSDDYLDTNIASKFVELQKQKNFKYDVVMFKTSRIINDLVIEKTDNFSSFEFTKEEKEVLIKSIYNKFLKYNSIFGFDGICGKFIKTDLIKKGNINFPEKIYRFEDAYFCKKVYMKAKNIYFLNYTGYFYINNNNSLCNKYDKNAPTVFINALNKLGEDNKNNNDFYIKVITTLTECEKMYFLNQQNKNNYYKNRNEFIKMIREDIFYNAIRKINFKTIPLHYKLEIILLRLHLYFVYFKIKRYHLEKNRNKY